MSIMNEFGDTQTHAIAPRIEIKWDPYTNDGPVVFHFERLVKRGEEVLERACMGVLSERISVLRSADYTVVNPETQEAVQMPGWMLEAAIKAATDAVYIASLTPPQVSPPDPSALAVE
jgi:hypothetical protein